MRLTTPPIMDATKLDDAAYAVPNTSILTILESPMLINGEYSLLVVRSLRVAMRGMMEAMLAMIFSITLKTRDTVMFREVCIPQRLENERE